MPKINSRKKGARGEKKAISVISKWTGLEFARVPASGGLRWKKADNISGDITCTDSLHRFDFSIEVKNYKEINFEHLIMPQVQSRILEEFWPQCIADAQRGKKLPLLMIRYDGMKPANFFITIMRYKDFKRLKKNLNLKFPYFKLKDKIFMNPNLLLTTDYKAIKKITTKIVANEFRA